MGLFSAGFGVSCKKQRLAEQYNHLSITAFAQIIFSFWMSISDFWRSSS
jgi:hypothetical protein